jgi:outer membrane cobalamin receptor
VPLPAGCRHRNARASRNQKHDVLTAQEIAQPVLDDHVVWAARRNHSASRRPPEGVVGYGFFDAAVDASASLSRSCGHDAAQHSGTGKANQYFLRGMNLDHLSPAHSTACP